MIRDSGQPITVYGASWCGDTRRSRAWLDRRGVPYRYVDIEEDPSGEAVVRRVNGDVRPIPVLTFPDGSYLVEPADDELAAKIGPGAPTA